MPERPGIEHEPKRELLDSVTLGEYESLPESMKEWLESEEAVPSIVLERLGNLDVKLSLREILYRIRLAIIEASEGKSTKASSFEDSRFSTFESIVVRGLKSCGAHTRAIGTTLRHIGIPTRFVDGMHTEGITTHDHAWLDIYNSRSATWIEGDTQTEDFSFDPGNERKETFHNWEELRDKQH